MHSYPLSLSNSEYDTLPSNVSTKWLITYCLKTQRPLNVKGKVHLYKTRERPTSHALMQKGYSIRYGLTVFPVTACESQQTCKTQTNLSFLMFTYNNTVWTKKQRLQTHNKINVSLQSTQMKHQVSNSVLLHCNLNMLVSQNFTGDDDD